MGSSEKQRGATLLLFGVKVAVKDMIVLIFQKLLNIIPAVLLQYVIMYLVHLSCLDSELSATIISYTKITQPFS